MNELEKKFLSLLQTAVQSGASDIHIPTGSPPYLRAGFDLCETPVPAFSAEELNALCLFMISDPKVKAQFAELGDIDGSFEVKGLGRFRFNICKSTTGRAVVLRVIQGSIPSIEGLKLPKVLYTIAEAQRGLVLVTGATGSGKSTTLAAMIDHLNTDQGLHILTIEDPVEFLHPKKKSRISQREIGRDTSSFAAALKSALRQDPDVILVGEMRDFETLDIALKAAETGHLVFSTVHTSDAMKTIGRLISLFPPQEQQSARVRLADNLHAIISQRLLPAANGGRVVAQEILVNNPGIADCIVNEKKTVEIPGFIAKGHDSSGMQTFDSHLAELLKSQIITEETAVMNSTNPADFQRNLSFGSTNSGLISTEPSSDFVTGMGQDDVVPATTSTGIEAGLVLETDSPAVPMTDDEEYPPNDGPLPTPLAPPALKPKAPAPAGAIPPKPPKPPGAA